MKQVNMSIISHSYFFKLISQIVLVNFDFNSPPAVETFPVFLLKMRIKQKGKSGPACGAGTSGRGRI
jgi:hypothetical protein